MGLPKEHFYKKPSFWSQKNFKTEIFFENWTSINLTRSHYILLHNKRIKKRLLRIIPKLIVKPEYCNINWNGPVTHSHARHAHWLGGMLGILVRHWIPEMNCLILYAFDAQWPSIIGNEEEVDIPWSMARFMDYMGFDILVFARGKTGFGIHVG